MPVYGVHSRHPCARLLRPPPPFAALLQASSSSFATITSNGVFPISQASTVAAGGTPAGTGPATGTAVSMPGPQPGGQPGTQVGCRLLCVQHRHAAWHGKVAGTLELEVPYIQCTVLHAGGASTAHFCSPADRAHLWQLHDYDAGHWRHRPAGCHQWHHRPAGRFGWPGRGGRLCWWPWGRQLYHHDGRRALSGYEKGGCRGAVPCKNCTYVYYNLLQLSTTYVQRACDMPC